ncbi:zf-DHHC-domain-containing protein [Aspergillus taichungensis]|uniref:Palmitoyltransferase n=1 Tax=Aspergillus taichungensis TaxID=482145 RepID=A0A2J5HE09_9EURO|nr:zf-DHHC-domain-containing protein [Aspergillus taichungensis]
MARPDRRMNLAVARIIPPILLGIVIYAAYAITKPLCIDYLINPLPKYHHRRRAGAGAAIIAVFYVLLIPVLGTYLRLLYNVMWTPGFLPRAAPSNPDPQPDDETSKRHHHRGGHRRKKSRRRSRTTEKSDRTDVDLESGLQYSPTSDGAFSTDTDGLEDFYTKDVFVCQPDGRPLYCSTCRRYKPDRAHHCREVDRCVPKMDHFCPWVGGVVSETSFKFFIQFVFYTMIFCIYCLIVCAVFTAELKRETGAANAHWAVAMGLAGLFGFFTFGMTLSSLQLATYNLTTIENLNRRSAVWTLAIRIPERILAKLGPNTQWAPTYHTVTYPLPPLPSPIPPPQPPPADNNAAAPPDSESQRPPPTAAPAYTTPPTAPYPPPEKQHIFAVLQTIPGENPFDLGSPIANLQQIMGYSLLDWLLPLKHSPCADHRRPESAFPLGPVVDRLKREAGLEAPDSPTPDGQERKPGHKHRHRRSRHRREEK